MEDNSPLKQFYYKRNRLQQLRGFYHVVQEGGFTKAAKKMRLNQSTITLQIQTLERDLGLKLFDKSKGGISLSDVGKIFYNFAVPHVQGVDGLYENFIQHIKEKKSNIIDIAANHVSISYILPNYIKRFQTLNPQVQFKIRNLQKDEAISRLLNNQIDFFIYPMAANFIPDELEFIPIVNYQPIVLTRKDHPLAQKENITLSDIKKYELIRIDPKFITLPSFEEIIKLHGLKTSIEFEIADWEILKKFVKADIGVAIISNICLEGERSEDLTGKVLTSYFPEMTYGILVKKGRILNDLLGEFINLMKTEKLLQAQIS
jgi:DNA-binding transcriptional LysR family regulator